MNELLAKYPAVLDVATVAEILGVTPATVRRLLKANVIPSVNVGRLPRVTKDKLCVVVSSSDSLKVAVLPHAHNMQHAIIVNNNTDNFFIIVTSIIKLMLLPPAP